MKNLNNKKITLLTFTLLLSITAFTQNLGNMQSQVQSQVSNWASFLSTIFQYLGAIGALVSLMIAAFQYYQGNENASKTLMKGLGASIIIFLLSFVPAIFGV